MDIGKFTIVGELGQGAGSRIYKVRREADSKFYALKIVKVETSEDKKYVEQVQNEYAVANGLNHPYLLKAHAIDFQKKLLFVSGARLLLEYVDGMALADCPGLPITKLLSVFFKVADGMAYMHSEGIYHADIKPDNIMIGRQKEVKIIDFGLAWRRGESKDRVQGTLEYLAPEQAQNKIVNGKTDTFNLGVTMYRALTGRGVPPEIRQCGGADLGTFDNFVTPLHRLNKAVPPELDELVRQMIRCNPDYRPSTMREVRDRIREIGKRMKAAQRATSSDQDDD
jgi:serine/threonine protein kinase